MKISIKSCFY